MRTLLVAAVLLVTVEWCAAQSDTLPLPSPVELPAATTGWPQPQDAAAPAWHVESPPLASRPRWEMGDMRRLPPPPTLPPFVEYPPVDPFTPLTGPDASAPWPEREIFEQPMRPPDHKAGVFQKLVFTGSWSDRHHADDVGISELELYGVLGFPLPTPKTPLLITPGFAVRSIDGPIAPDVPARLYDAYLEFRHLRMLSERWGMELAVSPGVYSDFEAGGDDAIRIIGRGVVAFDWRTNVKLVLGATWLDRDDVQVLPIAGVAWTPSDDWKFDLVFPRPKIARRIDTIGWADDWLYISGELAGGSWHIQRVDGSPDQMVLREYLLLLGLQRTAPLSRGRFIEVGYVFGRAIEYASPTPELNPYPTVMLRAGVSY